MKSTCGGLVLPTPLLEYLSGGGCAACSGSFSVGYDGVKSRLGFRYGFGFRRFLVNVVFQDYGVFDPDYFRYIEKAFGLSSLDGGSAGYEGSESPSVLVHLVVSLSRG